jgi:hypothetical protein
MLLLSGVMKLVRPPAVVDGFATLGYLGGAVATHVRLGDPSFVTPFVLGVLVWCGLYLRDPRLRAVVRRSPLQGCRYDSGGPTFAVSSIHRA